MTPSINLRGQCEEAIALYQQALGATTEVLLRYSDADPKDWGRPLSEDQARWIYHAEIVIGDQRVYLSDAVDFAPSLGTGLFLILTFEDAAGVAQAYEILRAGGTVLDPLQSTTYSAAFASVIDRFGLRWGLMSGPPAQ